MRDCDLIRGADSATDELAHDPESFKTCQETWPRTSRLSPRALLPKLYMLCHNCCPPL